MKVRLEPNGYGRDCQGNCDSENECREIYEYSLAEIVIYCDCGTGTALLPPDTPCHGIVHFVNPGGALWFECLTYSCANDCEQLLEFTNQWQSLCLCPS